MSTSKLELRIFDGSQQLFPAPANFLVTITDGNQVQRFRSYINKPQILFDDLPFFDNFGDNYSILVSADGYKALKGTDKINHHHLRGRQG